MITLRDIILAVIAAAVLLVAGYGWIDGKWWGGLLGTALPLLAVIATEFVGWRDRQRAVFGRLVWRVWR